MRNFLEEIVRQRRQQVANGGATVPAREGLPKNSHRLRTELRRGDGIKIIAEFKRASPSRGPIRADAQPAEIVAGYERGGASAISVLTEPNFFLGSIADLRATRAATQLPILRKDFIVHESQIIEAANHGADAILLIVAALNDEELGRLRAFAEEELGLDAVVEVHSAEEMRRAEDCGATIIGVNNRDLRTLSISLETSVQLAALAPAGAILISESGISSADAIKRMHKIGYRGFLVGESLMRAADPAALLQSLRGQNFRRTHVKICGVTNLADAIACAQAGVEMIGLNFSPQSLRCISLASAREIVAAVRAKFPAVNFVGVFVNQERDVERVSRELALDAVQLHGDESVEFARTLSAPLVIKALRVGPDFSIAEVANYKSVLLDGWDRDAPGGTGRTFDWSIAKEVSGKVDRLFLAGGLSVENVAKAIAIVQPFAVDVCSGVEDRPGKKNPEKIRQFVQAAHELTRFRNEEV